MRDGGPKSIADFIDGCDRIFHRIVQKTSNDRIGIELQLGKDTRHLERVRKIGISRCPQLRPVRLHREHVGAIKYILVGVGVINLDAINKFELADHGALCR